MDAAERTKRKPLGEKDVNSIQASVKLKQKQIQLHLFKQQQQQQQKEKQIFVKPLNLTKEISSRPQAARNLQVLSKRDPANIQLQRNKEIQEYKKLVQSSVIYIDNSYPNTSITLKKIQAIKEALIAYGAKFIPFFSEKVTLIISAREFDKTLKYPQHDIFYHIDGVKKRVWCYKKVAKILRYIGHVTELRDEKSLSTLLQQEKNDYGEGLVYFNNEYFYVYDLSKKYSAIAIKEWKGDDEFPKMSETVRGKSLFSKKNFSQSKLQNWRQQETIHGKILKAQRQRLKDLCFIDSDIDNEDNTIYAYHERSLNDSDLIREARFEDSDDISSSPMNAKTSSDEESPIKSKESMVLNDMSAYGMAGASEDNNADSAISEKSGFSNNVLNFQYSDMIASGITTNSSVPAILSTNAGVMVTGRMNINPFLSKNKNLKRRLIAGGDFSKRQKVPAQVKRIVEKQQDQRNPGEEKKNKNKKIDHDRLKGLNKCENCNTYFSDFQKHCKTRKHVAYATDPSNFINIDNLISELNSTRRKMPIKQ
ncbi:hypothetical protein DASC09_018440 [Saccharomycopsis crataegensis]|uniref:DBF4-type domain-containing protein n=1 Tax=Saccharomycopsis crataegensis TaxID=43959 RepID=A0AAV5QIR6_9ASCO|nr:hypothetical protein DASC09_018440 [Saccharomycopsis crataegensis]